MADVHAMTVHVALPMKTWELKSITFFMMYLANFMSMSIPHEKANIYMMPCAPRLFSVLL